MPLFRFVALARERSSQLSPKRHLFAKYDLGLSLSAQEQLCRAEIEEGDAAAFLNRDGAEFRAYLTEKYRVEDLYVLSDSATWEEQTTRIDLRRDSSRSVYDRSRPSWAEGSVITFHVPLEGQPELLEAWPRVFMMGAGHPEGIVQDGALVLRYVAAEPRPEAVRQRFDRDLALIHDFLRYTGEAISKWNASLPQLIDSRIKARRTKLEGLSASLGFPLRVRPEEQQLYEGSETVRRRITPPPVHEDPFLEMEHYEQILATLEHMVQVMERSPAAFAGMREEQLRDQLLVPLNGIYEGDATGETFNFEGKTDILIRRGGRNLFVAECKFWKGARAFASAIDQLLGYTSWRDTKTALLVFNRNKDFTSVLREIPRAVRSHPNFVREEPSRRETGFRYILHHRDDPSREILLTVLAFEVPR